ncbi:MAG: 1-(5-phosphoribosyl)-5-[(5-phosphoribosylamino)methylideneamino]imidazole-4-carboxamide isomerase [Anaerolineae bacterium]|jgi:phosphoribosylformimino-5-aminoimidazole carboxamide ribotide isomerase
MIVYPAIDLRNGRCVRLVQGQASQERVYAADPAAMAQTWEEQGAEWLHLVNLDGALGDQAAANMAAVSAILARVRVPVQFGGGLRSVDDAARLLDAGVARVVLGTVAVRQPDVVEEALARFGPARIAVGIDAREGRVATHGWLETSDVLALDLAQQMAQLGVERIVYTDIQRDGTLTGPNLEATRRLAQQSGLAVIASGGVSSLEDIRALAQQASSGIEGIIVGMALYEKRFTLTEALAEVNRIERGG